MKKLRGWRNCRCGGDIEVILTRNGMYGCCLDCGVSFSITAAQRKLSRFEATSSARKIASSFRIGAPMALMDRSSHDVLAKIDRAVKHIQAAIGTRPRITRLELEAGGQHFRLDDNWKPRRVRHGGPTETAIDEHVRQAVFRWTAALQCYRRVLREQRTTTRRTDRASRTSVRQSDNQPAEVLRQLYDHSITRSFRSLLSVLTAQESDGTLYLAVRCSDGTKTCDCQWQFFAAGEFHPVALAEEIVGLLLNLTRSTVHDKRFAKRKRPSRQSLGQNQNARVQRPAR